MAITTHSELSSEERVPARLHGIERASRRVPDWAPQLGRMPSIDIEPTRRNGWRSLAKRCFDITASFTILVALAPVLFASVVLVRLTSRGPAFVRQQRVGRDGHPFELLKLRSMFVNAEAMLPDLLAQNEASGPLFKVRDDPRVTPVGRWLRRLSLDDLPQLINVLRGEMSLVGPRHHGHEAGHWSRLGESPPRS